MGNDWKNNFKAELLKTCQFSLGKGLKTIKTGTWKDFRTYQQNLRKSNIETKLKGLWLGHHQLPFDTAKSPNAQHAFRGALGQGRGRRLSDDRTTGCLRRGCGWLMVFNLLWVFNHLFGRRMMMMMLMMIPSEHTMFVMGSNQQPDVYLRGWKLWPSAGRYNELIWLRVRKNSWDLRWFPGGWDIFGVQCTQGHPTWS